VASKVLMTMMMILPKQILKSKNQGFKSCFENFENNLIRSSASAFYRLFCCQFQILPADGDF
jgi:hypothetical protein